jgi:hypothetical protein
MACELDLLNDLLYKYKKNSKNTSYLKYNFIIELINQIDDNINIEYTLCEKLSNQIKIPLLKLKKNKHFNINSLYFLINENFKTDIFYLLIYKKQNVSTIYNGIIINLNTYNIICHPLKNYIYSKYSTLKRYKDDDIKYEYNLYKLYDGDIINLYFNNHENNWAISNSRNIDISNNYINELFSETYIGFFNKMLNSKNIYLNILDINKTYTFYLINKDYHISNENNDIKYISYNYNNKDHVIKNEEDIKILQDIHVESLNSIYDESPYGILLHSKNDFENRMVVFEYYQKIKKLVYFDDNIFNMHKPDLKYITVRAILKYKISKNEVYTIYTFLTKYYKYIMSEIYKIIDMYLNCFYELNNVEDKYKSFILKLNNDIKNNKSLYDIFYNNYILRKDDVNNIYRFILRDYIMQQKYIPSIYNILF